jgi:hypothetical protein
MIDKSTFSRFHLPDKKKSRRYLFPFHQVLSPARGALLASLLAPPLMCGTSHILFSLQLAPPKNEQWSCPEDLWRTEHPTNLKVLEFTIGASLWRKRSLPLLAIGPIATMAWQAFEMGRPTSAIPSHFPVLVFLRCFLLYDALPF